MTPFVTAVALMILVVVGSWGTIVLKGLFEKKSLNLPADDPRLEELREENQHLEQRLERLEEEVGFLRELRKPKTPPQLTSPNED